MFCAGESTKDLSELVQEHLVCCQSQSNQVWLLLALFQKEVETMSFFEFTKEGVLSQMSIN